MLNIYQEKYAGRRNSIWKLPSSDLVNLHGSKKTAPPSTTRTQKQKLHQLESYVQTCRQQFNSETYLYYLSYVGVFLSLPK